MSRAYTRVNSQGQGHTVLALQPVQKNASSEWPLNTGLIALEKNVYLNNNRTSSLQFFPTSRFRESERERVRKIYYFNDVNCVKGWPTPTLHPLMHGMKKIYEK